MKRTLFSALLFTVAFSVVFSQEQAETTPKALIDSLSTEIGKREDALKQIKKDKPRAEALDSLANDYAILSQMWEDQYILERETADKYRAIEVLLTDDDSVFNSALPDASIVPAALMDHYMTVSQVVQIQNELDRIDQTIAEMTEHCVALERDPMEEIPRLILNDLDPVRSQIISIKEAGCPTFSDAQKRYFDEKIRGRFNGYAKYFER